MAQPSVGPRMPSLFLRYRAEVERGLREALASSRGGLERLLHYHLGWVDAQGRPVENGGGKALRPALCLWACEGVGGDPGAALPAAVALELVHNFSLVHDDIQDQDTERRHRPTLWVLWGKAQALVAGNTLRGLADLTLLALREKGVPPPKALGASTILTERTLEMIEGQYLDLSYEGRLDITLQDYLEMVARKTGALMEGSLHLGAYIGAQDPRLVEALRRCGRLLGLAFQARDDILGVWGDEAHTGKATGADIRRRKKTLPVVYALQHGGDGARSRLLSLYTAGEMGEGEVAEVLDILEGAGARDFAQRLAEEKGAQAVALARRAGLPSRTLAELEELADFIVHREH